MYRGSSNINSVCTQGMVCETEVCVVCVNRCVERGVCKERGV